MSGRGKTVLASALVVVAGLASAVAVLHRLDQMRTGATLEEVLYISDPRVVEGMSLGHKGLMADLYWTRAVQYFGRKHQVRAEHYKLLAPLLEITTELDPYLLPAYKFGSIFLSQQPPEGAGQPDEAVRLVEKGIRANCPPPDSGKACWPDPEAWRLYYHLGFIHYIEREDYEAAAKAFEEGSRYPGSQPWMKIMAALMAQYGGRVETARLLWTKILENTDDQNIRENAVKRLRALRVDEDIMHLEELLDQFHQQHGRYPHSWSEMIEAGSLRGVPADPLGNAYVLKPRGRIEVKDHEKLPFIHKGLPEGEAPSLWGSLHPIQAAG